MACCWESQAETLPVGPAQVPPQQPLSEHKHSVCPLLPLAMHPSFLFASSRQLLIHPRCRIRVVDVTISHQDMDVGDSVSRSRFSCMRLPAQGRECQEFLNMQSPLRHLRSASAGSPYLQAAGGSPIETCKMLLVTSLTTQSLERADLAQSSVVLWRMAVRWPSSALTGWAFRFASLPALSWFPSSLSECSQ